MRCSHWIVTVLLLVLPFSVAWGQVGVRVGASFGYGAYAPEDINDFIDGTGEYYRDAEYEFEEVDISFRSEDLGGGLVVAGTVEYAVTPQIGVGIELVPLSTSGEYAWDLEEWFGHDELIRVQERCDFEAKATLVSLYGLYRVPFGNTGASLRLGGGTGILLGGTLEVDISGYLEYTGGRDAAGRQHEDWSESLEASGSGIAFHALVGIEYPIAPQIILTGDVAYRFASIGELEVDRFGTSDELDIGGIHPDTEEGKVLKWTDYGGALDEGDWPPRFRTDRGSDVELDFGGLYMTFGIAYVF